MARSFTRIPQIVFLFLAVLMFMSLQSSFSVADVTFFGSVNPDPPGDGNVEESLVVGLDGDDVPDPRGYVRIDGGTELEYDGLTVGDDEGTQGIMIISGTLTPGGQTSLALEESGSTTIPTVQIGHEGVGQLTVEGGGAMTLNNLGADLSLGVETSGVGTMIVRDPFSLVVIPDSHYIGDDGIGRMEILAGGTVYNTDTSDVAIIGRAATAVGSVLVDGAGSTWKINDDLVIGGLGIGTLTVSNQGLIDVDRAGAIATIGSLGRLELAGGTFAGQSIELDGTLGGSGLVRGSVASSGDALIDVPVGALLQFAGNVANQGSIRVRGGEVKFLASLENLEPGDEPASGRITLENGRVRFSQPLANEGVIALAAGSNYLHGEIVNGATGSIVVASSTIGTFYDTVDIDAGSLELLAGANALFLTDLNFMDESLVTLRIGDAQAGFGQIYVEGETALAGELEVGLADTFSPSPGDSFSLLYAAGGVTGEFDTVTLPALDLGLLWDLEYGANEVVLALIETIPGDFDLDDDADGNDFLLWQRGGSPNPLSASDLAAWQDSFGTVTRSTVAATAAAAVPEPTTGLLLVLGLAAMLVVRDLDQRR